MYLPRCSKGSKLAVFQVFVVLFYTTDLFSKDIQKCLLLLCWEPKDIRAQFNKITIFYAHFTPCFWKFALQIPRAAKMWTTKIYSVLFYKLMLKKVIVICLYSISLLRWTIFFAVKLWGKFLSCQWKSLFSSPFLSFKYWKNTIEVRNKG